MGLNRVAVGDVSRGSSCLATLGSGTESRWDSRTERDSASRSRFASTEMVGWPQTPVRTTARPPRRPTVEIEDDRFGHWRLAAGGELHVQRFQTHRSTGDRRRTHFWHKQVWL